MQIVHFEELGRDRSDAAAECHAVTLDEAQHFRNIDARLDDDRAAIDRNRKHYEKRAGVVDERQAP